MRALGTLRDAGILAREEELANAISADFGGRSRDETRLLELVPLIDAIRHTRASLHKWIRRQRVGSSWFLLPSRAYTIHQPLGVIGVMGAWNYPLLLTFGPLVNAIAAGNHVILKPSEVAPATAAAIAKLIAESFPSDYVAAVIGGIELSTAFAELPFDHLVFTGSSRVGSLVMRAASQHLTPVTLELGGKSPAIVHESYPLKTAVHRVLVGKLYNAGQTCIAPDYLMVPVGRAGEVERLAQAIVPKLYPRLVDNPDYSRILKSRALRTTDRDGDRCRGAG